MSNIIPYGYRIYNGKIVINIDEAKTIKDVYDWILN